MTFKRLPRRFAIHSRSSQAALPFNPRHYLHTRQLAEPGDAEMDDTPSYAEHAPRRRSPDAAKPARTSRPVDGAGARHLIRQHLRRLRGPQTLYVFPAMASNWHICGHQVECELSPCDPDHVLGLCVPVTGQLDQVDAVLINEVIGQAVVAECTGGYHLVSFIQFPNSSPEWRTSEPNAWR